MPILMKVFMKLIDNAVDVNNGNRFETYTIAGERGSGMICLNGAAARCVSTGDKVIIMCYCEMDRNEAKEHKIYGNETINL